MVAGRKEARRGEGSRAWSANGSILHAGGSGNKIRKAGRNMKTIHVPGGILHMAESKARCPHCGMPLKIGEVDDRLQKSKRFYVRHTCRECGGKMDVYYTVAGDIVAAQLTNVRQLKK